MTFTDKEQQRLTDLTQKLFGGSFKIFSEEEKQSPEFQEYNLLIAKKQLVSGFNLITTNKIYYPRVGYEAVFVMSKSIRLMTVTCIANGLRSTIPATEFLSTYFI